MLPKNLTPPPNFIIIEAIQKNHNQVHEAADVLYHLLVLLEGSGIKIEDVMKELKKRQNGVRQE